MSIDRNKPYNALPDLPPKAELETVGILKKVTAARVALAELKGAGSLIPDQAVLVHALGLQEARLSSEIENIITTSDALYRADVDDGADTNPATREVLRYRQALWRGIDIIRKENRLLTTRVFEEIYQTIKRTTASVRSLPGTKLQNSHGDIIYTPPEGESLLRNKLQNLEKFINENDELDPLVRMAVMHYQFEAIHPFSDGNGRTGRVLNILYLIKQDFLDMPVLYLSRYIMQNKHDYYAGLQGVTERQEWGKWILYILHAVEETARQDRKRIDDILGLMRASAKTAKKALGKSYSKDLIEALYINPYCKISFLEKRGIAKRQAASRYLRTLEKAGILRGEKIGRDIYYINQPFMDLLSK